MLCVLVKGAGVCEIGKSRRGGGESVGGADLWEGGGGVDSGERSALRIDTQIDIVSHRHTFAHGL